MNDHFIKNRYKEFNDDELQAHRCFVGLESERLWIDAELRRRNKEANDQSISQNERKNC